MKKEKIVYYRNQDDKELISINYTALVYTRYSKGWSTRFAMGSVTDRIENYFLYIGYTKTTKNKFEELLNDLENETKDN